MVFSPPAGLSILSWQVSCPWTQRRPWRPLDGHHREPMSDAYFSSFQRSCFWLVARGGACHPAVSTSPGGETRRIDENKPLNHTKTRADDPVGVKVDAAKVRQLNAAPLLPDVSWLMTQSSRAMTRCRGSIDATAAGARVSLVATELAALWAQYPQWKPKCGELHTRFLRIIMVEITVTGCERD